MTPLDHWQRQLEQTLAALGIETGYDAEAMRIKQAEFLAGASAEALPAAAGGSPAFFIAAQQKKEGENDA